VKRHQKSFKHQSLRSFSQDGASSLRLAVFALSHSWLRLMLHRYQSHYLYAQLRTLAMNVANTVQVMAKALDGSAIEAFWSGTAFLLTSTVFQPVIGSFSHIFGRKTLIYVSLGFFLVGSIVPAVANNFTVVLVGRSIQGIGGGGIICLTEMVLVDTVPLRERGKWFSFFGAMWSIGTVGGPLLGKYHGMHIVSRPLLTQ
jgi:MFS family permease